MPMPHVNATPNFFVILPEFPLPHMTEAMAFRSPKKQS